MEIYEKSAKDYEETRGKQDVSFWVEKLHEFLLPGKTLEIGCGTGRYTIPLLKFNDIIPYGLDISMSMLKIAYEKEKRVNWINGDAHFLPFSSESFRNVFYAFSYHQLENPLKSFREADRVLEKPGRIIVLTSTRKRIEEFSKEMCFDIFPSFLKKDLERFRSDEEIRSFFPEYYKIDEKEYSTVMKISRDRFIENVRKKYLSTFHLLPDGEFERYFPDFLECVKKRFNETVEYKNRFKFFVGEK